MIDPVFGDADIGDLVFGEKLWDTDVDTQSLWINFGIQMLETVFWDKLWGYRYWRQYLMTVFGDKDWGQTSWTDFGVILLRTDFVETVCGGIIFGERLWGGRLWRHRLFRDIVFVLETVFADSLWLTDFENTAFNRDTKFGNIYFLRQLSDVKLVFRIPVAGGMCCEWTFRIAVSGGHVQLGCPRYSQQPGTSPSAITGGPMFGYHGCRVPDSCHEPRTVRREIAASHGRGYTARRGVGGVAGVGWECWEEGEKIHFPANQQVIYSL